MIVYFATQPGLQVTRLRLRVRGAKKRNQSLAKYVPGEKRRAPETIVVRHSIMKAKSE
jgi:hypothetical protein